MAKISTEDCKDYLDANFCSVSGLSQLPDSWKRLNKTGKKGEPIVRRFLAKNTYPVIATVVEDGGVITGMSVEALVPWHPEFGTLSNDFHDVMAGAGRSVDAHDFWFYDEPNVDEARRLIRASDFCFAMGASDGELWIGVTPIVYFKSEGAMYDQQLDVFISHLCEHVTDEVSEATFVPQCKDYAKVIRDMVAAGFVVDPDFIRFMGGTKPLPQNQVAAITEADFVTMMLDVMEKEVDEDLWCEVEDDAKKVRQLLKDGASSAKVMGTFEMVLGAMFETEEIEKEKDACGIDFDLENVYINATSSNFKHLTGFNVTKNGVPYIGGEAGGDWEASVFFVFYHDGTRIRLYVPKDGNCYNTDTKRAYGNEDDNVDERNIKKRMKALGRTASAGRRQYIDDIAKDVIDIAAIENELNRELKK